VLTFVTLSVTKYPTAKMLAKESEFSLCLILNGEKNGKWTRVNDAARKMQHFHLCKMAKKPESPAQWKLK